MGTTLSVQRGGVRVRKSVVVEDAPLPTVLYVVESERDEPVAVRLLDELPGDVPDGAIAVHDAFDAGGWRVDGGDHLEYRSELEPGETRKTAFFVKAGEAVARRFFVTPSIEAVRPTRAGRVAP